MSSRDQERQKKLYPPLKNHSRNEFLILNGSAIIVCQFQTWIKLLPMQKKFFFFFKNLNAEKTKARKDENSENKSNSVLFTTTHEYFLIIYCGVAQVTTNYLPGRIIFN